MDELEEKFEQLSEHGPAGYSAGLIIRFAGPQVMRTTYPDEWSDYYTQNQLAFRDPVVMWGLLNTGTIRWSEIRLPDTARVFEKAQRFGINYGATVATGSLKNRSILGIARSDREFSDAEMAVISTLFGEIHEAALNRTMLSEAQIEALKCIARGQRHTGAAHELGISESALKARLSAARRKLRARSTAEAIMLAKERGLL